MIEIRKHPSLRSALYIHGLDLRLPVDGSWVPLSIAKSKLEASENLQQAFASGLVDFRVVGDYNQLPNWYIDSFRDWVRVPVEILKDEVKNIVSSIIQLRVSAHPIMWVILRKELYALEVNSQARREVLAELSTF